MFKHLKQFTQGQTGIILRGLVTWPKFLFTETNPRIFYDVFGAYGGITVNQDLPLFNMGYWQEVDPGQLENIKLANQALFDLACRGAEISSTDELVVDAGCGFGTNAIYCVNTYNPKQVIGLNISAVQRKIGQKLIVNATLQDRIKLLPDSATTMPFPDNVVNKMVSIEAAAHFDTRQDFFKEAYRVLKPGGLLSVVDITFLPPKNTQEKLHLAYLKRLVQMPQANIYNNEQYLAKLEKMGFEIVGFQSIYEQVVPPFERWFLTQFATPYNIYKLLSSFALISCFIYPCDYIHIKVRKPEQTVNSEQ